MNARQVGTISAAVGAGVAGGVFFAFSTFVMSAVRKLPAAPAITAMQSINRQAPTPVFMTLLFGTALLSTGMGVHAALHRDRPGATWSIVGAASYLVAIGVTAAYHVPRNDRLATFDALTPEAARYWATYAPQWTAMNHVRTVACIAAAVASTLAARAAG